MINYNLGDFFLRLKLTFLLVFAFINVKMSDMIYEGFTSDIQC